MKLGKYPRAALALTASLLSVVAAAQNQAPPAGNLNISPNAQFVGNAQPGVRKATAIVNGEVVTESDIDQRLALIVASNRVELPPEELQRFRAQVLRNLIDEALQIQEAARQEIAVEDRDVNQYFDRFAERFQQTPANFSNYLRSIGSSERSLKRQIRGELAWQRVQGRQIQPFVQVGDTEVQAILDRLNASRGTAEYRVAEIFLSGTPETAAEARANAARIAQQVRSGASFPAYARQFSEASTAAVGGDLGWLRVEQLPAELGAVVQQMPVGSISDPIEVPGGYSIIALADSRQLGLPDPRDAQLSLMQMSLRLPANANQTQADAVARRLIQATQSMGGCGNATQTATSLGAELVSNDQVGVRELPPALQQTMLSLSIGQASPPFLSNGALVSLILCGRDDPPPTSMPSFEQVEEQLSDDRVGRRAQRYLRDLRRDAVIDYR